MPEGDPGAYQAMSTDELIQSIEGEMASIEQDATAAGMDLSGEEAPPAEGDVIDAEAENALTEAESAAPSDSDAEAALSMVLSSGMNEPTQILDALRGQGFELIRVGESPMEEAPEAAMEAPSGEEEPFRDARRRAAERAVGGTV